MSQLPPEDLRDEDFPEPPRLRALRRMVMMLTVASIVAVLAVAGALVIRATRAPAPVIEPGGFAMSDVATGTLSLPAGAAIVAAGAATGTLIVVTRDADGVEHLRLFDAATGAAGPVVRVARE